MYILTGYACNGKTTLLQPLAERLQQKIGHKQVLVTPEYVPIVFASVDVTPQNQQSLFLACSLGQWSIVRFLTNSVVICDRSPLDCLAFNVIRGSMTTKEAVEFGEKWCYQSIKKVYYIDAPPKHILANCFTRVIRQKTLNIDTYYAEERVFHDVMALMCGSKMVGLPHPAVDESVVDTIVEDIAEIEKILQDTTWKERMLR